MTGFHRGPVNLGAARIGIHRVTRWAWLSEQRQRPGDSRTSDLAVEFPSKVPSNLERGGIHLREMISSSDRRLEGLGVVHRFMASGSGNGGVPGEGETT
ncbi:MAG: hypothetical protein DWP92_00440, partial [Armatimonadetes bacterium]